MNHSLINLITLTPALTSLSYISELVQLIVDLFPLILLQVFLIVGLAVDKNSLFTMNQLLIIGFVAILIYPFSLDPTDVFNKLF